MLVEGLGVGSPEPGPVIGHHLSAHAAWDSLSGGDHGLARPQAALLAELKRCGADFCVKSLNEAIQESVRPRR